MVASSALAVLLAAGVSSADAARFTFDNQSGQITFEMQASLHEIDGTAQQFSGELDIGSATPSGKISVQASQLTTHLAVRDERMYSYCLEVEQFPTVDLLISAVTGDIKGLNSRKGSGRIELRGQMTVRSAARDIIIPATYRWEGSTLRLIGDHQLLWTDYGVPDPSIIISTLSPELDVHFDVVLREKP